MRDIIRFGGLSFYGFHGVTEAEKETGRVFEVDCEIEVDLAQAGHTDKLNDTVDYKKVYDLIKESVENKAYSLLEGLAEHLAEKILEQFPIYRVTLKVRKMNPPIAGQIKFIEVEITRHQENIDNLLEDDKL